MESNQKQLLKLLDIIVEHQREVTICHDFYQSLEREMEKKKEETANPEDYEDYIRAMSRLSREYEEKSDLLYENLNNYLLKAHDLAEKSGQEISRDFKKLWDYMTNPVTKEVEFDHVLRDVE